MMIATGRTVLGLMLLCTLPGIVFGNGNWDHCPENITVYNGCDVTIYALFKANNSQNCGNGYVYHIHIRESGSGLQFNDKFGPNDPVPPVIVEGTNGMICNISVTSTVTQPVGVYDIQFLAIYGLNLMNKPCEDHLFVIDTSPFNTTINVTCEGVHVEWEGPVLADGFDVLEYIVTILGIVYNTTNTSIRIPYGGCLEYHKQYDVSIAASYCGRIGNSITGSFYTAIDPMVDGNIIEDPLVYDRNDTSSSLYLKFKMSRDDCTVSHPKTVTTNMTCTSSLVPVGGPGGQTIISVLEQPVTVRHDGSIIIDTTVPDDNRCTVELMFNNGELNISTDPFDIYTNQLDSCSFIANGSAVAFLCKLSQFSSLSGCRVELTGSRETAAVVTSHMCNSTIVMIGMPQGLIGGLCNGVYTARCYGLRNDTSTPGGRNDTAQIVAYDNNPDYSTDITVTASDSCTSSVTSATSMETCTATPTLEPSVNPVTTNGAPSQTLLIVILAFCLLISVLVGVNIFLSIYRQHNWCSHSPRRNSGRRYSFQVSYSSANGGSMNLLPSEVVAIHQPVVDPNTVTNADETEEAHDTITTHRQPTKAVSSESSITDKKFYQKPKGKKSQRKMNRTAKSHPESRSEDIQNAQETVPKASKKVILERREPRKKGAQKNSSTLPLLDDETIPSSEISNDPSFKLSTNIDDSTAGEDYTTDSKVPTEQHDEGQVVPPSDLRSLPSSNHESTDSNSKTESNSSNSKSTREQSASNDSSKVQKEPSDNGKLSKDLPPSNKTSSDISSVDNAGNTDPGSSAESSSNEDKLSKDKDIKPLPKSDSEDFVIQAPEEASDNTSKKPKSEQLVPNVS